MESAQPRARPAHADHGTETPTTIMIDSAQPTYGRKRGRGDMEELSLPGRLAAWMQANSTPEESGHVRATVRLAMDLERDVRRCLNQRAASYEYHRLESLRIALANPIPAAAPPRHDRDDAEACKDLGSRSPIRAVRRAPPVPKGAQSETISSKSKDPKTSEIALMEILTLNCESA